MKKYNSISLIETLISLTIVGISIVALMPVMTVQKTSNDPTKGNIKFWGMFHDGDAITYKEAANDATHSITRVSPSNGYPVSIGTAKLPKDVPTDNARPNRNFVVDASGFGNIIPLYVGSMLNYRNETAEANDTSLHLKAGAVTDESADCIGSAKNLYIDANNVIIENVKDANINNDAVKRYNLCKSNHDGKLKYNNYPAVNLGSAISGIYSLKHGSFDNEYFHVDSVNRIIGIGRNAVKFSSPENLGQNTVVIASHSQSVPTDEYINFSGLIIGNNSQTDAPPANNILNPNGYVIYKSTQSGVDPATGEVIANADPINIKANLTTATVTATRYIAASDLRLKNIVGKYVKGLKYILQINPVEFTYKSDKAQEHHIGVIAQDLKKVFPESVYKNSQTGYLSINTDGIFYALLNSIKELNAKNAELKKQNDELEAKVAQIRKIRDDIRNQRGGQNE